MDNDIALLIEQRDAAIAELQRFAPLQASGLWDTFGLVLDVLAYGQEKYPANDWAGMTPQQHRDAMMRHVWDRDEVDESGHLSLAHAATRALMLLHVAESKRRDKTREFREMAKEEYRGGRDEVICTISRYRGEEYP